MALGVKMSTRKSLFPQFCMNQNGFITFFTLHLAIIPIKLVFNKDKTTTTITHF